jgi:hypothetical protein
MTIQDEEAEENQMEDYLNACLDAVHDVVTNFDYNTVVYCLTAFETERNLVPGFVYSSFRGNKEKAITGGDKNV